MAQHSAGNSESAWILLTIYQCSADNNESVTILLGEDGLRVGRRSTTTRGPRLCRSAEKGVLEKHRVPQAPVEQRRRRCEVA
ncbi:hypothetical protein E2562_009509 [Oryza meyeriana var. granulata]|uniref:Uncharacterized protein n=1 Tax=Oryza meyeriana var. granulata TaxID=110450 RepID=A0A6G1BVC8_9ORYZ|nr:hypothetical protein E2562_009509 [Oryza meyeriana var. granulata]